MSQSELAQSYVCAHLRLLCLLPAEVAVLRMCGLPTKEYVDDYLRPVAERLSVEDLQVAIDRIDRQCESLMPPTQ